MTDPSQNKAILENISRLNSKAWLLMVDDAEKSMELVSEAVTLAESLGDKKSIAEAAFHKAWNLVRISKNSDAIYIFNQARYIYRELGLKSSEAKTLNGLGTAYLNLGMFADSVDCYTKCRSISLEMEDWARAYAATINLSMVLLENEKYEDVRNPISIAQKIEEDHSNVDVVQGNKGVFYIVYAGLYRGLGDFTLAEQYLKLAWQEAEDRSDNTVKAVCCTEWAKIDLVNGKFDEAESWIEKLFTIQKTLGDPREEVFAYFLLGECRDGQGRPEEAIAAYTKAMECSHDIDAPFLTQQIHKKLADFYENRNDFKSSLIHLREFNTLEKRLFDRESILKIRIMQEHFQAITTQNQAEIYRLKNVDLKSALDRLALIHSISQSVISSLELSVITETIYNNLSKVMPVDVFGIAIYSKEEHTIDYRFFMDDGEMISITRQPVVERKSIAAWCVENKKPVFIKDLDKELNNYVDKDFSVIGTYNRSVIYIPLTFRDEIVGLMTVQSEKPNALSTRHLRIMEELSPILAVALENSSAFDTIKTLNDELVEEKRALEKANEEIRHLANHDPLTGLANRRLLREQFEFLKGHADRQKTKMTLFYLDLNKFKMVNDTHHHDAGDFVLCETVNRIQSHFRRADVIARIGGDEFVMITEHASTTQNIDMICSKINELISAPLYWKEAELQVGVSIGVSVYPDDGTSLDLLLKKADSEMYKQKKITSTA